FDSANTLSSLEVTENPNNLFFIKIICRPHFYVVSVFRNHEPQRGWKISDLRPTDFEAQASESLRFNQIPLGRHDRWAVPSAS
ncbi:MAG: hypothetical protein ACR2RV_18410, partial [Verrucomicrobiales bacterium]